MLSLEVVPWNGLFGLLWTWTWVDVHLGRRGPQQRRMSTGDTLESSSPGLRMRSIPLMQALASSVLPRLPCRRAGSLRGTPVLGLWGCCGGVYTRTGDFQTPCRRVWDNGLWYPCNGTSLIPGPRVGLLELPRPRTGQIWGPPRNQGPAPPAGCRQAPAASVAQHLPAHWFLRLHQDPAYSLRSHPRPRGAPPPPGLLSWRSPCSLHRDWAPTSAVSILHAVGKNTDAGEGGGVLPMDSVKKMGSWAQAGAA